MNTTDKPRVLLKSKNIQLLMEHCIENKLEFTVIPGPVHDEWEVEINVKNLVKAVELGMFMKTNKFDLAGTSLFPKTPAPKVARKSKVAATPALPGSEESKPAPDFLLPKEEKKKKAARPEQPSLGLDFGKE